MLTGIDVRSFVDPRDARKQIRKTIVDGTTVMLVANDNFLKGAGESVARHMKTSTPPVVISLPIVRTKGWASPSSIQTALREINMFSRSAPRAEAPKRVGHRVTHYELEARPCTVCGHMMDPGMRICSSCGSIRRSVRPRGLRDTPARKASCKTCGVEIPEGKNHCDKCLDSQKKRASKPVHGLPFKALVAAFRRLFRRVFGKGERG